MQVTALGGNHAVPSGHFGVVIVGIYCVLADASIVRLAHVPGRVCARPRVRRSAPRHRVAVRGARQAPSDVARAWHSIQLGPEYVPPH